MPVNATVAVLRGASVAAEILGVSVAYAKLQATVSAQLLAADVYAAVLRAETIVGEFITVRTFFDAATASDAEIIAFSKLTADALSAIEDAQFLVDKTLVDALSAAEVLQRDTTKPLVDLVEKSDAAEKLFTFATKQEFLGVADTTDVVPQKGLVDVAYSLEGPAFGQTYVDPTYFAQDYAWDGAPTREFFKVLVEAVDSTDDFLGEAVADDDQTILFAKTHSTSIFVADPHAIAFTRPGVTDLFAAADAAAKNLSRPLADSGIISEVFDRVPVKGLLESVDAGDSGSLRMTDYTDINYFAQDYVGISVSI
jgi:hypothetical protein